MHAREMKQPHPGVARDQFTERYAAQATRLATLAQGVATAVLAGVQRTTEMNREAARALLRDARPDHWQAVVDDATERWRFSWRAYQICSTTAGSVLGLCQTHTQSNLDDLWRALGDLTEATAEAPYGDAARCEQLRGSLVTLQRAQKEMFDAAFRLQDELVALGRANEDT
ncbi:MAG: hypothetical protein ABIU95_10110 [Burkholderiales bacterium]